MEDIAASGDALRNLTGLVEEPVPAVCFMSPTRAFACGAVTLRRLHLVAEHKKGVLAKVLTARAGAIPGR